MKAQTEVQECTRDIKQLIGKKIKLEHEIQKETEVLTLMKSSFKDSSKEFDYLFEMSKKVLAERVKTIGMLS